jgi:GNAT superfamily N-acetyltransferase
MLVRDATPHDAEVIARFNGALAEETEGRAPDADVLRRGVERGLAQPAMCRYWVAEAGGEVVGQAMVTYEWSDWRDGVLWWFQSVYVAPHARERGVFRALYEHVAALARADPDARGLRLYVEGDNARARRVYERLGMRDAGYLVFETDWSSAF